MHASSNVGWKFDIELIQPHITGRAPRVMQRHRVSINARRRTSIDIPINIRGIATQSRAENGEDVWLAASSLGIKRSRRAG